MTLICGPLFIVAEDYETFDIAEHKDGLDQRIFIIAAHTGIRTIMRLNTPIDRTIALDTPIPGPISCPT